MNEIRRIIKEYKEAIAEPGMSDYRKERAKINAFDEIVAEVECIDKIKAQTESDIKKFFAECNTSVAKLDRMPMVSKKNKGGVE